MSYRK